MRLTLSEARRERAKEVGAEAAKERLHNGLSFDSPGRDLFEVAVEDAIEAACDQLEQDLGDGTP